MDINLYTFSKRIKSTLTPTGSGTVVTGSIKEQSSIVHFDVSIDFGPNTSPHVYNYAYVPIYNRYYWASDWSFNPETGFWTCSFSVDPYASAKADILATSAYILYDSHNNADLVDDRIPRSRNVTITTEYADFPFTINRNGKVLMTVVNNDGVVIYDMEPNTLTGFLDSVESWISNIFNAVTIDTSSIISIIKSGIDMEVAIFKQLTSAGNVMQNIKSCLWLPLDPAIGTGHQIKVGNYTGSTHYSARIWPIDTDTFNGQTSINIPWQFSDWRNKAEVSSVYLEIPFVGMIAYNADNLVGISALTIRYTLDILTGDLTFKVLASTNVLGVYKTNIAVEIPIGVVTQGTAGGITSGAMAGATAGLKATGGNLAGAIAGGIGGMLIGQAKTTNATIVGGLAGKSGLALDMRIRCTVESNHTLVDPHSVSSVVGEPRHQVLSIGSLSGYVQTSGAQVAGAWTDQELDMINSGLDGGLYIE